VGVLIRALLAAIRKFAPKLGQLAEYAVNWLKARGKDVLTGLGKIWDRRYDILRWIAEGVAWDTIMRWLGL
jgi:hypothetical protein